MVFGGEGYIGEYIPFLEHGVLNHITSKLADLTQISISTCNYGAKK